MRSSMKSFLSPDLTRFGYETLASWYTADQWVTGVRQGHSLLLATLIIWGSMKGWRIFSSKLAKNIIFSSFNKGKDEIKSLDLKTLVYSCLCIFISIYKRTVFQRQKKKGLLSFLLSARSPEDLMHVLDPLSSMPATDTEWGWFLIHKLPHFSEVKSLISSLSPASWIPNTWIEHRGSSESRPRLRIRVLTEHLSFGFQHNVENSVCCAIYSGIWDIWGHRNYRLISRGNYTVSESHFVTVRTCTYVRFPPIKKKLPVGTSLANKNVNSFLAKWTLTKAGCTTFSSKGSFGFTFKMKERSIWTVT